MLDTITREPFALDYDRSGRKWNVIGLGTGEVVESFPPKAKGAAFRFALEHFAPDLFAAVVDLCMKYPQMERAIFKGAQLVVGGGVEAIPGPTDGIYALVESSDQMGRYAITCHDGHWACNCPAAEEGFAPYTETGVRACAHMIAFTLHMRLKEDRF